jgi:hypothetical protein
MSEPQKLQKYICITFGPYESIKELSTDVNRIINADYIDKYTPVGGLSIASTNKNTYKNNPVILYTAAQTMMLKTENPAAIAVSPAAIAVSPAAIAVSPAAIAVSPNESEKEFEAMKDGTTSTKKVEYDNVYDGSGGKRSRKHKRSQHKHKRSQHKRSQHKHKRSHKTRKY